MDNLEARFREWEKHPPPHLRGDPIWRMTAYRMALFLSDLVRDDVDVLVRGGAPRHKIEQLEGSVESVEANISEGYSKYSGRDRARFFENAHASARESRGWYHRSRHWLGAVESEERQMLMTQVIKMLTVAIPGERSGGSERRMRRPRRRNKPDDAVQDRPDDPPNSSNSNQY